MIADLPEAGWCERTIRPLADKFSIAAQLGLETKLDPDASEALSLTILKLAQLIDAHEAEEYAFRQMLKFGACFIAIVLLFAAMAMLS